MANSVLLVLAPHPDDDVLGCGGTLARAASQGADVRVIYVTDGSASHVRSKRFPPAALARIREREAASALYAIGVKPAPMFLRAPDGALAAMPEPRKVRLVRAIAQAVRDVHPDVVFGPWSRDPHVDHVATAELLERALQQVPGPRLVCMYAVWLQALGTPGDMPAEGEVTTVEVCLSAAEVAKKRKAILEHVSQTTRLIGDDPDGFCIDPDLLETWLLPVERFYCVRDVRSVP